MDEIERKDLAKKLAEHIAWYPAGDGGIAAKAGSFDNYIEKLSADERSEARRWAIQVTGQPKGEEFVYAGAGNVVDYEGVNFAAYPNELTQAIRASEEFKERYQQHIKRKPLDLSFEDTLRIVASMDCWQTEVRKKPTGKQQLIARIKEPMDAQNELHAAAMERSEDNSAVAGELMRRKLVPLLTHNASQQGDTIDDRMVLLAVDNRLAHAVSEARLDKAIARKGAQPPREPAGDMADMIQAMRDADEARHQGRLSQQKPSGGPGGPGGP